MNIPGGCALAAGTPSTAAASIPGSTTAGFPGRDRCDRRGSAARGLGEKRVQWRLRDWGISRQRYWGCPIPMIHCEPAAWCRCRTSSCRWCCPRTGARRQRQSAAAMPHSWKHVCPRCGGRRGARPTPWTPSSIRPGISCASPVPTTTGDAGVDERVSYWLPVDQYIGGIEHAILHLLYSRFWTRVMRDWAVHSRSRSPTCSRRAWC
jgi:leucyl-tRNA synthetase